MDIWVTLLRGINVGGHNILPMADLRRMVTELGGVGPATHVQSGNLVYRADDPLGSRIADTVEADCGFRPAVVELDAARFRDIAGANPFPEAVSAHKTLHVFFLAGPPRADAAGRLTAACGPTERAVLVDGAVYLHLPDLLAGSPVANRLEVLAGVAATGRNWRTVTRLLDMIAAA